MNNLKFTILNKKKQYERATYHIIPGKGKAVELKKISGYQELERDRDKQVKYKGFLGQQNYFIYYYNDGYMSFYTCQNIEYKHQEGTLR